MANSELEGKYKIRNSKWRIANQKIYSLTLQFCKVVELIYKIV